MEKCVNSTFIRNMRTDYDPPLDAGISDAVELLREAGIETFESCEAAQVTHILSRRLDFTGIKQRALEH